MPALSIRVPGAPFPAALFPCAEPAAPAMRAFLRSVMPALEGAFGVEADPDFPEAIAALVARLQAEPDGVPVRDSVDIAADVASAPLREPVPA